MNAKLVSIILIFLFISYIISLFFIPYSSSSKTDLLPTILQSASENYIPTHAIMSDRDGLLASLEINNIYIPPKTIIMFSGEIIPSGWVECNGENGTPNLRGRIPLVFNNSSNSLANKIGNKGGKYDIPLSISEIPSHTHTGKTQEGGFGKVSYGTVCGATTRIADDRDEHTHTFTTNSTGGSQPHNNMPPYYVLRFIMKT
jgi:microcystin-dependent protein